MRQRFRASVTSGWIAAILTCLLAGCGSRPPGVPANLDNPDPWGAVGTIALAQTPASTADAPPVVLAISGGGAEGAFAAGFLCGWTETGNRPRFDIVTGVSSGALAATFAFLGPEWDEALRESFTQVSSRDIYRWDRAFAFPFNESVVDTDPLRQRMEALITSELLDAVAGEYRQGRRLYVASFNLDARKPVIWDLGAIAASNDPRRLERYQQALMASAAIPAFFPPVYVPVEVEGETYWQMHVDGGVYGALFVHDLLLAAADETGGGAIYALVNTKYPRTGFREGVSPNSLRIGLESAEAFVQWHTVRCLQDIERLALDRGMRFQVAWIPREVRQDAIRTRFDKMEMRATFERARQLAREHQPWQTMAPEWAPVATAED